MADQKAPQPIVDLSPADVVRFWSRVDASGDGCWLWPKKAGAKMAYGQFGYGPRTARRIVYAHRLAYLLTNDGLPAGLDVLHSCDTPSCVNPAHLRVGTHLDNMRDAADRGRLHVGRPRRRTVSDEAVEAIRSRRLAGEKVAALATEFGVSGAFVCLVAKGLRRSA